MTRLSSQRSRMSRQEKRTKKSDDSDQTVEAVERSEYFEMECLKKKLSKFLVLGLFPLYQVRSHGSGLRGTFLSF